MNGYYDYQHQCWIEPPSIDDILHLHGFKDLQDFRRRTGSKAKGEDWQDEDDEALIRWNIQLKEAAEAQLEDAALDNDDEKWYNIIELGLINQP